MSPRWDASVRQPDGASPTLPVRTALALLGAYKALLSPLFRGACRFHPSCSTYMAEAIRVHGLARGSWLGIVRLSRCHPFGSSGFDPVPPRRSGAPRAPVAP